MEILFDFGVEVARLRLPTLPRVTVWKTTEVIVSFTIHPVAALSRQQAGL